MEIIDQKDEKLISEKSIIGRLPQIDDSQMWSHTSTNYQISGNLLKLKFLSLTPSFSIRNLWRGLIVTFKSPPAEGC